MRAGSLVSVIVCNYNYSRYLERAIESLAQQTHRPIELHLVDEDVLAAKAGHSAVTGSTAFDLAGVYP